MDIAAIYCTTEPYLNKIVYEHRNRYGGDQEELLSQARYHFVLACHSWRPGGYWKTLQGWIGYYVSRELREAVRTQARRSRLLARKCMHLETVPMRQSFDLHAFMAELSEDAQAIVELVVGPHFPSKLKDNQKKNYLIRFLGEMHWTAERIFESFQEIREILT